MQSKILVVEDDPITMKLVSTILLKYGYLVGKAVNGIEGVQVAQSYKPDLILMDVMMPLMDGFEACKQIRKDPEISRTPIILLTALSDLEQKIKGYESGADDYIEKPFDPDELLNRVKTILARFEAVTPHKTLDLGGKIISVFSLRGGAGVSTIATNLSAGITELWDEECVLVDMNWVSGQSALYLNLPLKNTWEGVTGVKPIELDAEFLDQLMINHPRGVKVLAAPRTPEIGDLISDEMVKTVLEILKRQYHYIVLDLPHDFRGATLTCLDVSDAILLVTPPEIAGIRCCITALATFDELGYTESKGIKSLVNWVFPEGGVSQDKIEKVIKQKVDLVIPYSGKNILQALNLGNPVIFSEPLSPISSVFEDLAFAMSKPEHNRKTPKKPSEAWNRVAARIKKRKKV